MGLPEQASGGKYEILDRLAVGGMAEIYLAKALGIEGFEKYVVLKRILPQFAADPEFVEMFLDEARLAALLHHNNIAQVYDMGQLDGAYFFTMEYLHGKDVRSLFRRLAPAGKRIELQHALTIAAGVAAGLHYAHDMRGPDGRALEIVHRDVSPSNVVITYAGAVKIVDFGVAHATQRTTKTKTGGFKGKLSYLSPEQCVGEPVDRRSDVFSLGILLYELTVMRRLFRRTGREADYVIMDRIVKGAIPRPTSVDSDYPPELEAVVMRALSVDREQRYATAGDLLADLEAFAAQERIPLSQQALARYMKELFGNPQEPWLAVVDDDDDEMITVEDDGRLARAAEEFLGAQTPPTGVPAVDAVPEGTIAVATRSEGRAVTPLPLPAPPEEEPPTIEQPVAMSERYPPMSDESAPSAAPTPAQAQPTVPVARPSRRRGLIGVLVFAIVATAVAAVALVVLRGGGDADDVPAAAPAATPAPAATVADAAPVAVPAVPAVPDAAPVAAPVVPDAAPAVAEAKPPPVRRKAAKPKRNAKRKRKPKRKRRSEGLIDRTW